MSDAFHSTLVAEARADGEALRELGEHISALHGAMWAARRTDFDDVRRQFAVLYAEFQRLHDEDMGHHVDQYAHRTWRERVRRLAARVDEVAGVHR